MSRFYIFFALLIFSSFGYSQYDIEKAKKNQNDTTKSYNLFELKQNVFVGTSLSLSFGNSTLIYFAPQVGYSLSDNFSVGFQSLYQHLRSQLSNIQINAFGLGPFARFHIIDQLALETSFNYYTSNFSSGGNQVDRYNSNSWLLSALYSKPLSQKGYYFFSVSYNLLTNIDIPEPIIFANPTGSFRLYYKFGLVLYPFN